MKKTKIRIFPHVILLIEGGIFCFLLLSGSIGMPYIALFELGNDAKSWIGRFACLIMWPIIIFLAHYFWPHVFGRIVVTDTHIKYHGLFLPTVKFAFEDIQYAAIRTFKDGNVVCSDDSVDAFKFLLLSTQPLPNKRIDKIRSSKKKKLIKYAVSEKLCQALDGKLTDAAAKLVEYQLFLYKRYRGRITKQK